MDLTDSENSDAGESSWTMYLGNSSASIHRFGSYNETSKLQEEEEEEEEKQEDLSMLSDASSGPRYYYGDDEEFFQEDTYCSNNNKNKNKNKIYEEQQYHGRFYSCLDDTASSPLQRLPKQQQQLVDFSQSFSTTKFKGTSAMSKNLNFQQKSLVGKPASDLRGGGNQRKRRG